MFANPRNICADRVAAMAEKALRIDSLYFVAAEVNVPDLHFVEINEGRYYRSPLIKTLLVTSKKRIIIPKSVRQQMGVRKGCRMAFSLAGDRIEMRVFNPSAEPAGGFGMLLSNKRAVPVDFNATMIGLPVKR